MSFMSRLYETYENVSGIAGIATEDTAAILVPVGHQLIKAHITVTLGQDGDLLAAEIREDSGSIAPVTEASASRVGSTPNPHRLVDKLEYLAGDYEQYTGKPTKPKFDAYIRELKAWCDSPYSNAKVQAIHAYLQQGRLIEDLVRHAVLHLDEQGHILAVWPGEKDSEPAVFKLKNVKPQDLCVRFRVEETGPEPRAWMDRSLHENYVRFSETQAQDAQLCYVSGQVAPAMGLHPKSIVRTSANAKLVSANDSAGFTYRGRLLDAKEALGVSREVAQKAYAALKWLLDGRALMCDKQALIAFGVAGQVVPSPSDDTIDLLDAAGVQTEMDAIIAAEGATAQVYAELLNRAILSYSAKGLERHTTVVVMALDSATAGRLSISFYRELLGGEYLESVKHWHRSCAWLHTYYKDHPFYGAPSLRDIAKAAYSERADGKLIKGVIERLMPCVLGGAPLPADIVNAAVWRASQPMAMEKWEWNKALSIACALYRKQHEKEGYPMSLMPDRSDRDYLYGRLLAVADWAEQSVLYDNKDRRQTNAMRHMCAFSQHPFHLWQVIEESIRPYLGKLEEKGYGIKYKNLITEIISRFEGDSFEDNSRLNGSYLHGYHCQRQAFLDEVRARKAESAAANDDTDE